MFDALSKTTSVHTLSLPPIVMLSKLSLQVFDETFWAELTGGTPISSTEMRVPPCRLQPKGGHPSTLTTRNVPVGLSVGLVLGLADGDIDGKLEGDEGEALGE